MPAGLARPEGLRVLPYVCSYVFRDGKLFISLMADGGIYEWEPLRGKE